MEGLIETYQQLLSSKADANPGVTLANFFSDLYNIPKGYENVAMFSKLIKLYGKQRTFEAMIEFFENGADPSRPFGLLSYICKKKLEAQRTNIVSLNATVTDVEEKITKLTTMKKKIKIRSPFDE